MMLQICSFNNIEDFMIGQGYWYISDNGWYSERSGWLEENEMRYRLEQRLRIMRKSGRVIPQMDVDTLLQEFSQKREFNINIKELRKLQTEGLVGKPTLYDRS